MENGKKISEQLFNKYQFLAKKYSYKVENFDKLSFTREDLVQEFSIKIFTSIKSYGKLWGKFRAGLAPRPVALKYYIETALSNKCKDFMKYIERESVKTSIDEVNFDFGYNEDSSINVERNQFIVHDIDLLEGLTGIERSVYSLFLRGYNKRFLRKVYSNKANDLDIDVAQAVDDLIEGQKQYLLKKYGNELTQKSTMYSSYSLDDDY